ncbi:MAG: hypothetical protein UX57_C0009G0004 [Candidatus Uhrbacteria bacterium GW2011_GWE2_46_68]|uniref:DUF5666 domain-containing protein n=2 Tax=Candidatus Uhriibacteriota TaxID=1752732 RepID=A0A0G1Q7L3_9BACT|nr:MAG: hypothetical protein UX45_C0006G0004 [Candidatus Uhrbacteria bacterium GW2011_GWF2_46_218]KKU40837.1 MAG: hypothetical protein UX57_C0009G0004 [Candidatus Uhrbacteria bacterium GW2011_GWE2_46_68]
MKKILLCIIATAVIVGGGAFFGGIQYAKLQTTDMGDIASRFSNLDASQRSGMSGGPGGFTRSQAGGGGFVSGEILSLDAESMTIELPDGGSKLIFFSDASKINKMTESSSVDMATGMTITITGTSNDDGSVTASTIQILPEGSSFSTPPTNPTTE